MPRRHRSALLAAIALAACGTPSPAGMDASSAPPRDASAASPDAAVTAPDASTAGQDASPVATADAGPRGECLTSADCSGSPCLRIPDEPGGWYQCAPPVAEQTDCTDPGSDECCKSSECTAKSGGGCFVSTRWFCGGMQPPVYNVCVYDECATAADCTAQAFGACVPAGAYGEARALCSYGGCRLDSDCASRAGGRCRPFFSPCRGRFDGFWCTYADGACRGDSDCTAGLNPYCAHGEDGATTCEEWVPPP